jgi:HK97 family phage major capsid protein
VLMQAVIQAKIGYYTPNYIIVHPNDYLAIVTARDSYGRYQFQQNLGSSNSAFYVGGAMVIANTAIQQGSFLVGDFEKGATLFQRDDLNISFSNQNQDNFITGFVTVLVEERLANVIYRPNAFVYGTFNAAIVSGS